MNPEHNTNIKYVDLKRGIRKVHLRFTSIDDDHLLTATCTPDSIVLVDSSLVLLVNFFTSMIASQGRPRQGIVYPTSTKIFESSNSHASRMVGSGKIDSFIVSLFYLVH